MESITIRAPEEALNFFIPLFQQGFFIMEMESMTVTEIITKYTGTYDGGINNIIRTIFLNGQPVDDPHTVHVNNGDRLALSGAMPGLVGAVMRSGSILRSFRDPITCRPEESSTAPGERLIEVRLFNTVAGKKGISFLEKGIIVRSQELEQFFENRISSPHSKNIYIAAEDNNIPLSDFIQTAPSYTGSDMTGIKWEKI